MKVIDLFCGTGGFGLGARQAGFDVVGSIDIDPVLTSSHAMNFNSGALKLADITELSGTSLLDWSGGKVDGIIGGPPCQGFSSMGRRDQSDPRRDLVGHFFRIVAEAKPSFFVMENVVGLLQGDAKEVLEAGLSEVPSDYNILGPIILDASDFGVPTSRKRCFVVGYHRERCDLPVIRRNKGASKANVRDAICDLVSIKEIGVDARGFDVGESLNCPSISPYAAKLKSENGRSTGHRRTKHTKAVVARFESVGQGKTDPIGRHQRLSWDGLCPTLRAGTGSDRGSFQSVRPIHPDEPRVITVREAARLQGFPDTHLFHPTVWHSFRMIGNSVSPIVSAAVMDAVAQSCGVKSIPDVAAE